MMALFRSELLKTRSTRTALVFAICLGAAVVGLACLIGFVSDEVSLYQRSNQFELIALGSLSSGFSALIGIMAVTSEFRHGTIRPTLLTTPRRWEVIGVKVAAAAVVGLVLGILSEAVSFGLGRLILNVRSIPFWLDSGDVTLAFVGVAVSAALWGALGAGLGAVVRNQVGAIVGLLIWSMLLEGILFALVPGVGRFAPGEAGNALTSIETAHLLAPLAGGLLLAAYAVVLALGGAAVTEQRDVP